MFGICAAAVCCTASVAAETICIAGGVEAYAGAGEYGAKAR